MIVDCVILIHSDKLKCQNIYADKFKLQNVFVQIAKFICPSSKLRSSDEASILTESNRKMSRLQNIFVQIANCDPRRSKYSD